MLEAVGFPVAVNPETRLAAIARKRGWLVEHWEKAPGAPQPLLPIGTMLSERERASGARRAAGGRCDEGAAHRPQAGAFAAGPPGRRRVMPGARRRVGPLELVDDDPPALPGPDGCACARAWPASAAATCPRSTARLARYFDDRSSASRSRPATRSSADARRRHAACVLEPVLGHASPAAFARVPRLRAGRHQPLRARRLRPPRARPADRLLRRHRRRLGHRDGGPPEPARTTCPTDLSDEAAVLVEPTACAVHAALLTLPYAGDGDPVSPSSAPARWAC